MCLINCKTGGRQHQVVFKLRLTVLLLTSYWKLVKQQLYFFCLNYQQVNWQLAQVKLIDHPTNKHESPMINCCHGDKDKDINVAVWYDFHKRSHCVTYKLNTWSWFLNTKLNQIKFDFWFHTEHKHRSPGWKSCVWVIHQPKLTYKKAWQLSDDASWCFSSVSNSNPNPNKSCFLLFRNVH